MENYVIFTDSSSNITPDLAHEAGIEVIPLTCVTKEGEMPCYDDKTDFNGHSFYDELRETGPVKTSMVNMGQFRQAFEPIVKAGQDILFFAMSSGISGTCAAAREAAAELMKEYPGRVIRVVDTLAASFGEGIFALKAAVMRKARASLDAVAKWAEDNKRRMCQYFTVDDLMFLHKGGRISSLTARIGSLASIKPLLTGDSEGKIVSCGKVIGRKKSLQALADLFDQHAAASDEGEIVAIAHGDCEADAEYLAGLLKKKRSVKDVLIRCYEPGTGSHVGPGAMALFFFSPVAVK
ncbi:MAG: DegV family protein [Clostridia bacterium]|nr:DegV family protein [Clostridia bacterium]